MLPSALALIAVAAVVLLLIGIFGTAGDDQVATPPTTPTPGRSIAPSVTASTPTTSAATSPPPTTSAAATPVLSATPPTVPTAFPDIVTVVLNSTDEAGLAGRVSTYLGELGWTVGPAGNFEPTLDVTTVYYPEGYEDAARALAAATPSPSAVAPVVEGVAADSLTVVLGADAVDWLPAADSEDLAEPTESPTELPTESPSAAPSTTVPPTTAPPTTAPPRTAATRTAPRRT